MSHMIIEIFRSSKKDEMYLYVEKQKGLKDVPEMLMERFGAGVSVMTMLIKPDQKLARANAQEVMDAIKEKGFYLQMPPAREEYMLDIYKAPTEARY